MAKICKKYYYSSTGEQKINCYMVLIPKELLNSTNIKEDDNIKLEVVDNKIVIAKE